MIQIGIIILKTQIMSDWQVFLRSATDFGLHGKNSSMNILGKKGCYTLEWDTFLAIIHILSAGEV